jgi:hypothetical protein
LPRHADLAHQQDIERRIELAGWKTAWKIDPAWGVISVE